MQPLVVTHGLRTDALHVWLEPRIGVRVEHVTELQSEPGPTVPSRRFRNFCRTFQRVRVHIAGVALWGDGDFQWWLWDQNIPCHQWITTNQTTTMNSGQLTCLLRCPKQAPGWTSARVSSQVLLTSSVHRALLNLSPSTLSAHSFCFAVSRQGSSPVDPDKSQSQMDKIRGGSYTSVLLSLSPSHNSDGSTCLDDGEPPPNALPSWWSHGNPFLVYLNTTLPCPALTMCPVRCAVSIPVSELYWIPHVVSAPPAGFTFLKMKVGF